MIPLRQHWPDAAAERYRAAGYWRGETLAGFLDDRARSAPHRIAIVDGNRRWTYRELNKRASAIARGFLNRGFSPGDRVIVQLPNVAEFFSVVYGLFRARLVPVFTLPAHRQVEVAHFAATSEARGYVIPGVWAGFDYRSLAAEIQKAVPAVTDVISLDDSGSFSAVAALETAPDDVFEAPLSSDVAFLQLSGGSTGLSKLIPRTHDDYIYSFRASNAICGITAESVYLAVLPVAHNFTMSSPGTFGLLYAGGTVVLCPQPNPDVAFKLIERERVTITALVPPLALLWIDAAARRSADLSSLQVLQVGGARLADDVARRVRPAVGCTLQQVFGMAEGLVNYTRLEDPEEVVVTTQGRPISPDDELLIVDDDGQPSAPGTPGHLLTRGPYTIRAYHNAPEANARAFTPDGFYRTGDIVSRAADGNLIVHGRAHDHINRGGEKVSAEEIEGHLLAHAQVHDAVVVAVPDPYLGERACAYVIPRESPPTAPELKRWMRERGVAAFKVPDQVVFVERFPETGVGKISRKELRAALLAQRAAAAPVERT
jgi:2,3-dihydroxybenzoate-AMP ligase